MMDDTKEILLTVFLIMLLGFMIFGLTKCESAVTVSAQKEQLNRCAKAHNVYECELIAVPEKAGA